MNWRILRLADPAITLAPWAVGPILTGRADFSHHGFNKVKELR
jgi:hypothetical protein